MCNNGSVRTVCRIHPVAAEENSMLHAVLARKKGIPISLSVVLWPGIRPLGQTSCPNHMRNDLRYRVLLGLP